MSQLDAAAIAARNRLVILFVVLCVLDSVLVAIANDKWAVGRIIFTIGVMYFVVQGKKWAIRLLMGICGLLAAALVAMVILLWAKLSTVLIVGSIVMIILCIIIPFYMTTNPDLNRYFSHKRQTLTP